VRKNLIIIILALFLVSTCKSKATQHYDKGLAYFSSGDISAAIREYKAGLKCAPKDVKLLYALGFSLLSMNRVEEAIIHFGKCVKFDDSYFGGYKGMGLAFSILAQNANSEALREKSEEYYQKAIQRARKNSAIYSNMGDLYRQWGKFEEAKKTYMKGYEINPKYGDLKNGLVALYLDQHKLEKALEEGMVAIKKPYQQEMLKAQLHLLLAKIHFERAMEFQEKGNKNEIGKTLKSAEKFIRSGSRMVKNPTDFIQLTAEIEQFRKAL